jgi:formate dehydrogenase subunit gamma
MTSDGTFRVVAIVCLAGVVIESLLHYARWGRKVRAGGPAGGAGDLRRFGLLERIVLLGLALTLLCLAVTGLAANLLFGEKLEGWLLMLHVAAGGGFILCLLLMAVFWAEDCRFRRHDADFRRAAREQPGEPAPAGRFDAGQKVTFWAALLLGLIATLTTMVSMLPVFSPEGMEVLRDLHRYGGLLLALFGYIHVYQTVIVRRGRLGWLVSGKVNADWARHYHPIWWQVVKGKEAK